ncbi:MAG TPA: response regulator [Oligoflexus sp.]|uniref:response regulator n=1 Tax=Oligoflexus sp. TaxID=1971216 RepID=UPI002D6217DE|nr:response regulator [Oligoflexus sp.]HYX31478.1 response regulator [Oligoflexus sp.]
MNRTESSTAALRRLNPQEEAKAPILILDDHYPNLIAIEAILNDPSYELVLASSGFEALCHIENREFVVILSDIRMPIMDGFEFARRARKHPNAQKTPIILLTAEPDEIDEADSFGIVECLCKPLEATIVRNKVAALARLNQQTAQT